MSRVFLFDFSVERIQTLTAELTKAGHEVTSNLAPNPDNPDKPQIITDPVDVVGVLMRTKPFPDLIIAETDKVNGGWLGGLVYDMELGTETSLVLLAEEENDKVRHLIRLYGAHYWPTDTPITEFLEYLQVFFTITCD